MYLYLYRSRKRRTSYTQDEREYLLDGDDMDECNAALVLMSLSCSPNSPRQGKWFKLFKVTVFFCVVQAFIFWVTQTQKKFWITEIECQYCCRLTTKMKPWTLTMTVKWHYIDARERVSIYLFFIHIFLQLGKVLFSVMAFNHTVALHLLH